MDTLPRTTARDVIDAALKVREGRRRIASHVCRSLEKRAGHELDTYDLVVGAIELPDTELTQLMIDGAWAYMKSQGEAQLT